MGPELPLGPPCPRRAGRRRSSWERFLVLGVDDTRSSSSSLLSTLPPAHSADGRCQGCGGYCSYAAVTLSHSRARPARRGLSLPAGSGESTSVPAAPSACPGEGFFSPGQVCANHWQWLRSWSRNGSSLFRESGASARKRIANRNRGQLSGALDAVVTLPASASTPVMAGLEAEGGSPFGLFNLNSLFKLVAVRRRYRWRRRSCAGRLRQMPFQQEQWAGRRRPRRRRRMCVVMPCPKDPENDSDRDGRCALSLIDALTTRTTTSMGTGFSGDDDNCPTAANPNQLDRDWQTILAMRCQTSATCSGRHRQ
jgi:hypothetical protein